jgi:hypothetical protein
MKRLGKQTKSGRGFPMVEFADAYGAKCSLQASSLAKYVQPGTSAIWLGVDDAKPQIMKSVAQKLGMELPPGEVSGWMPYPIPEDVLLTTRMHLERGQVQALVNHLQAWLDSDKGEFKVK